MSLRIDQDHRRFREIVRGKIKQNLRKYITQGEMLGKKGKEVVSIPLPQIDIPHFRFGSKQSGGLEHMAPRHRRAHAVGHDVLPGLPLVAGSRGERSTWPMPGKAKVVRKRRAALQ